MKINKKKTLKKTNNVCGSYLKCSALASIEAATKITNFKLLYVYLGDFIFSNLHTKCNQTKYNIKKEVKWRQFKVRCVKHFFHVCYLKYELIYKQTKEKKTAHKQREI